MGRDDRLLQKIRQASQEIPVRFACPHQHAGSGRHRHGPAGSAAHGENVS
ncbi:MAG: hypothetical protein LKE51_02395 [Selenomonas sp.]|nr:hypothetical protein [Selenomonas sp.]